MAKVGISTVSLLPWSLGENGLMRSWKIASELGYDGLQVLPFKVLGGIYFRKVPWENIISFEGAWNNGNFMDALYRTIMDPGNEELPTLLDWLLFGEKGAEEVFSVLSEAKHIVHSPDPHYPHPLEINPELGWDAGNAVRVLDLDAMPLVLDTLHLRRLGRHGEPPLFSTVSDCLYFISELKKEKIAFVHFHPKDDNELKGFLRGEPTNPLSLILMGIYSRGVNCPIIVEIPPLKRFLFRDFRVLSSILQEIKKIFQILL